MLLINWTVGSCIKNCRSCRLPASAARSRPTLLRFRRANSDARTLQFVTRLNKTTLRESYMLLFIYLVLLTYPYAEDILDDT